MAVVRVTMRRSWLLLVLLALALWHRTAVAQLAVGEHPSARDGGVVVDVVAQEDGGAATAQDAGASSGEIVAQDAGASSNGGSTWRPPPPPPETVPAGHRGIDNWEERDHASFEVGLGASAGFFGVTKELTGYTGGLAVLGVHFPIRLRHDHSEKGGSLEVESFRWCVPVVMCAGIGMIFAPTGAILANDFGLELRVGGAGEGGAREGGALRASLRPTFRYGSGAVRTGTFLGILVPEVGVVVPTRPSPVAMTVAWSVYPVDVLVAPGFALALDPARVGVHVPVDGSPLGADVGAEITVRWLP